MKTIIIFIIVMVFLVMGVNAVGSKSEDSWYTCDQATGVNTNNNQRLWDNGTSPINLYVDGPASSNGVLALASGKLGKSCYISNATTTLVNTTTTSPPARTKWSFSFWLNISNNITGTGADDPTVVPGIIYVQTKAGTGDAQRMLFFRWNGSQNAITFNEQTSGANVSVILRRNMTYHVAGNAENNAPLKMWINGTLSQSTINVGTLEQPNGKRYLGQDYDGTWKINFTIDDLRIWQEYSLTQTDINFLFNNSNGTYNSLNSTFFSVNITSNISISQLQKNDVINISGNGSSNNILSICQIITNMTGINEFYNFSLVGTEDKCSQNFTIAQSLRAVINFTLLVNNTLNDKQQLSLIFNITDITTPIILSSNWSFISITDGTKVNISVNSTDIESLQEINTTSRNPNGLLINRSCLNINSNNYICNTTYFDGDETSVVGIWNLTVVSAMDTSNNLIIIYPNATMEVTAVSSGSSGSSSSGGGGGGGAPQGEQIIILGNLSLVLKPPLINTNVFAFPAKTGVMKFKIELVPNKEIDRCISNRFTCTISNNIITVSLNISNSTGFITKIEDKITLIDKASLAKTIDASVRFINFAYAIPYDSSQTSTRYLIFSLSDGNKGRIQGIRLWFIFTALTSTSLLGYLAYKYR